MIGPGSVKKICRWWQELPIYQVIICNLSLYRADGDKHAAKNLQFLPFCKLSIVQQGRKGGKWKLYQSPTDQNHKSLTNSNHTLSDIVPSWQFFDATLLCGQSCIWLIESSWYDHYDNVDEWSSFSSMHHHYHQQQQHYKSIAKFAITINRLMTIANGWGLLGLWFMRWPTRDSNQNSRLLATWPLGYRERRRLCVIGISLLPKTIGSTLCHYLFLE